MVECINCGYCCHQTPCPYGKGVPCIHLVPQGKTFLCGIYEKIKADPNSEISPAFGAGCSSSLFNSWREEIKNGNLEV